MPMLGPGEEPLRAPDNFHENEEPNSPDPSNKFDKLAYLHRLEQVYGKKLRSLEIFGTVKTICPSEYFLHDSNLQEIKDHKQDKNFVPIQLLKLDHNT
jgi:hypothetical protein